MCIWRWGILGVIGAGVGPKGAVLMMGLVLLGGRGGDVRSQPLHEYTKERHNQE